jgi:hypothetical protein
MEVSDELNASSTLLQGKEFSGTHSTGGWMDPIEKNLLQLPGIETG